MTDINKEYVVVTPAYNEEQYIKKTINSMIKQTHKPSAWVIIDDGSQDSTFNIIKEAAVSEKYIIPLKSTKRKIVDGDGLLYASEARAFNEGLNYLIDKEYNPSFIVKLDADLEFNEKYFEELLQRFSNNPRLGIAGGVIWELRKDKLVQEKINNRHVRGATKTYRLECFQQINGVQNFLGWDAVDEIIARDKQWDVESFQDLQIVHLRPTASRGGRFRGWARNGYMAYYIGYRPVYFFIRVCYWLLKIDFIKASGLFYGFASHWIKNTPRLENEEILKLVKEYTRVKNC